jgi:hypothetical protein
LLAHYKTRGRASLAKLDNGVMAQTKALSRIAYRRSHFVGGSSDLEEELMLLRLETAILRRYLTEVKKQAELMAKFGEYLKSGCWRRHSFFTPHLFQYIVTRHLAVLSRTGSGFACKRGPGDLAEYRNGFWEMWGLLNAWHHNRVMAALSWRLRFWRRPTAILFR